MGATVLRVYGPTSGDWPALRDLVIRVGRSGHAPDLWAAVAESASPAAAWRQRLGDMLGGGRCCVVALDERGTWHGFAAAYIDGDLAADRCAIVRHLFVSTRGVDLASHLVTLPLLDRIEAWALEERAREVLLELGPDDAGLGRLLDDRGYAPTGVSRPTGEVVEVEWSRSLHRRPKVRSLAVAG